MRVRRILNALRVKDESLAEATRRVEELEGLLRLARDDAERSRTRAAELEQVAKDANEHAAHVEAVSRATKLECSRLKGSLADAEFDLDLSTKKYERLLESHAAKKLAHDLVELHLREAARDHAGDEPRTRTGARRNRRDRRRCAVQIRCLLRRGRRDLSRRLRAR